MCRSDQICCQNILAVGLELGDVLIGTKYVMLDLSSQQCCSLDSGGILEHCCATKFNKLSLESLLIYCLLGFVDGATRFDF